MSSSKPAGSIHDFTVKDARGNDVDLSIYKGKVLLVVNVASQWYCNSIKFASVLRVTD
ncbi:unnamed protein product [Musa textilis]